MAEWPKKFYRRTDATAEERWMAKSDDEFANPARADWSWQLVDLIPADLGRELYEALNHALGPESDLIDPADAYGVQAALDAVARYEREVALSSSVQSPQTPEDTERCTWAAGPYDPIGCILEKGHGGKHQFSSGSVPKRCPDCGSDRPTDRLADGRQSDDFCTDPWHDAATACPTCGSADPSNRRTVGRNHDIHLCSDPFHERTK